MSKIQIVEVNSQRELKKFTQLPFQLHAHIPNYIPPLFQERWGLLHPKKNPFYQHASVRHFLAYQNNKLVGGISAHHDPTHEKFKHMHYGCFGFFESVDDPKVAQALVEAAANFLKTKDCKVMVGPLNFTTNDETGLLVEGFEHPMMVGMPYNPAYYPPLLEGQGFTKLKELYAWYYDNQVIPEGALQIADAVLQYPGLTIRNLDKKHFYRDIQIIREVFNSAWSNNWGFVPITEAQAKKAAHDFKHILDERFVLIAEVNGDPAAICLGLPNIYEITHDLKGKLWPFGWVKFLYRLKTHAFKTGRLALLGVKKEYRGSILGGLSVLLYVKFNQLGLSLDYKYGELSWTLEDNEKINQGIEFMGGRIYKKYRVYQRQI